jgi:hypothetical protein
MPSPTRTAFVIALVAFAAGAARADDFTPPARAKSFTSGGLLGPSGGSWYVVVERGAGETPLDEDLVDVHYKVEVETDRDPDTTPLGSEAHEKKPLSQQPEWTRELLRGMPAGSSRKVWGQDLSCDHGGCAPGSRWRAELELLSIERRHDDLPDGMVITSGFEVSRGKLRASLDADDTGLIVEVRLTAPDTVTVSYQGPCSDSDVRTVRFALDTLRARLAHAGAIADARAGRFRAAAKGFAQAIALDPMLDDAYVELAAADLRLGRRHDAAVALAPLAQRDAPWSYWQIVADPRLRKLHDEPEIRALRAKDPADPIGDATAQLVEPTGRWLVAIDDLGIPRQADVFDRATGQRIAVIAVDDPAHPGQSTDAMDARWATARRALAELGFTVAQGTSAQLDDAHQTATLPGDVVLSFAGGQRRLRRKGAPIGPDLAQPRQTIDWATEYGSTLVYAPSPTTYDCHMVGAWPRVVVVPLP